MVAEQSLLTRHTATAAPLRETAWDHKLDSLLEDLQVSIGSPREGHTRVIEQRQTPTMKHTTTEYTSPDHKTQTRTERYEYHSALPQQNGTTQKVVQHSSMMYHTNRSDSLNRSNSLKKTGSLTRSESLNRSESLRRRARDPSPDLTLRFDDDTHYATPPPPLPTQRLKQNIVELDSLLHDLNTVKSSQRTEVSKNVTMDSSRGRGSSISYGVTSEGTQTETPEPRPPSIDPRVEPISHSTPHQHRKDMSTFSSERITTRRDPSPKDISTYSTERIITRRDPSPKDLTTVSSERIITRRDPSPKNLTTVSSERITTRRDPSPKSFSTFSSERVVSPKRESSPPPVISSSTKSYTSEHISSRSRRETSPYHRREHSPPPVDTDLLPKPAVKTYQPPRREPSPARDSDSDPSAKTIIKNYHYYYTLDGSLKPGMPHPGYPGDKPDSSPQGYIIDGDGPPGSTTNISNKSYHYSYRIGPDGQPVPVADGPASKHPPEKYALKPDTDVRPGSSPTPGKTIVTHRAYNYSWSSQGQPISNGHPSPDRPDRYYVVDGTKPIEPAHYPSEPHHYPNEPHHYPSEPHHYHTEPHHHYKPEKRPTEKPKPFPVSEDDRPVSGDPEISTTTRTYNYTWDSRRDTGPQSGPPYHTLPGKRDSSPSPHPPHSHTTTTTYNYSWSYPGQPGHHPSPPTRPSSDKPPKRLDDLMATFGDIEDAPPTPPLHQRKPIELKPVNVSAHAEASAAADAETTPLVENKSSVEVEKSVNKAGSPVYYPPSYSDPKPLQETPKSKPHWMMEMEKEKMSGKYKYKEKERKSEFKAVPLCVPLCCAAPLCCEIM